MNFLASLLAPMLPKLLDWVVSSITSLGVYLWKKYESGSRLKKSKREVDAQLKRLQSALKAGFDGTPITKDQKREIDEAFTALLIGY